MANQATLPRNDDSTLDSLSKLQHNNYDAPLVGNLFTGLSLPDYVQWGLRS